MCVSTETRKNVTNHRGQSQNKQSDFERTCPTCEIVVEWLESKDCGKRHRVNVKHSLGKLAEVAVGSAVVILN